ncbi:MAG TPA: NUDIX hydrolase, partial [Planctomycetota bacterium]|nr:NUDIX hydrolase [Planctomycetota bacterium]
RELLEETGYEAPNLEYLTEGSVSSGLSAEVVTFYLARGVRRVASGGGDASEDIVTHVVALDDVDRWLRAKESAGVLIDTKVWTGLFFASRGGTA